MIYIGIDTGKKGALVILHDKRVESIVPFDEVEYIKALQLALLKFQSETIQCCLEKVSAMPKQGVVSMFNFGQNFGFIQGVLMSLGINFKLVTPQKWKKEFGVTSDKSTSIQAAKKLFPKVDLRRTERCRTDDDNIAEALLLAEYARRTYEQEKDS